MCAFILKVASGTSAEGHNVGEINRHISVLKDFNTTPRKFPACSCSVLLTDFAADRLSEGSVKDAPMVKISFNFVIFLNKSHICDKYIIKLWTVKLIFNNAYNPCHA